MLAVRLDPLLCMQSRKASVLVSGSILVLPRDDGPLRSLSQRSVDRPGSTTTSTGVMYKLEKMESAIAPQSLSENPLIAMIRFQSKFRKNLFSATHVPHSPPMHSVRHLRPLEADPRGVHTYLTQIPPGPGMRRKSTWMAAAVPTYDLNSFRSTPRLTVGCSRRIFDRSLIRSWVWLRPGTKPRKNLGNKEPSVEPRLKLRAVLEKS